MQLAAAIDTFQEGLSKKEWKDTNSGGWHLPRTPQLLSDIEGFSRAWALALSSISKKVVPRVV